MKVMTYVVGFANDEEDGIYIEKLLNGITRYEYHCEQCGDDVYTTTLEI